MIVSKNIMYKYSVGLQIIIYECTGWAKKRTIIYSSLFTITASTITNKKKRKIIHQRVETTTWLNKSKEQGQYWRYLNRKRKYHTHSIHKLLIVRQNGFEWPLYLRSNFLARLSWTTLGKSKQKCDWQHLTIWILLVWNNFMKNLFTTKSKEFKSLFLNGQASRCITRLVNISLRSNV